MVELWKVYSSSRESSPSGFVVTRVGTFALISISFCIFILAKTISRETRWHGGKSQRLRSFIGYVRWAETTETGVCRRKNRPTCEQRSRLASGRRTRDELSHRRPTIREVDAGREWSETGLPTDARHRALGQLFLPVKSNYRARRLTRI